ncbi:MAG: hypothetical protein JXR95_08875 [Deltaproteobacteria bacterium]|nr:hypothetical protein [Deltaproteobacteria bacterium]
MSEKRDTENSRNMVVGAVSITGAVVIFVMIINFSNKSFNNSDTSRVTSHAAKQLNYPHDKNPLSRRQLLEITDIKVNNTSNTVVLPLNYKLLQIQKSQIIRKIIMFHKKRLKNKFGEDLSENVKQKIIRAAIKAGISMFENKNKWIAGNARLNETLKRSQEIIRIFSTELLETLGDENYLKYTCYESNKVPWNKLITGSEVNTNNKTDNKTGYSDDKKNN